MNNLAHNIITLTCPTCGAKLKLVDSIQLLVCGSCGNEHIVRHSGGAIYLAPMAADVRQIRVSADKTAAELAVVRLSKELKIIEDEVEEVKVTDYTIEVPQTSTIAALPASMLMSFALIFVFSSLGIPWLTASMVIVLIALIIWYSVLNDQRKQAGYQLREEELDRLQAQYNTKHTALIKNQQIADS